MKPESNLGCDHALAKQVRSEERALPASPDPCALALHRSASPCISHIARSSHMPLASPRSQHVPFRLCSTATHSDAEFSLGQRARSLTLAHISATLSSRWIKSPEECPRFARTRARQSRQRKMEKREKPRKKKKKKSRTNLACCPACACHVRVDFARSRLGSCIVSYTRAPKKQSARLRLRRPG